MNLAIQIVIGGLLQGAVFAVIALGFSLVFRVTGVINLSQGAFCVLGALLMYTFEVSWGWPTPVAAVAASLGTAGVGLALGAVSFVPALPRLPISSMLMMTAGLLTLLQGALLVGWSSQPYALPPFSGEAPVVLGVSVSRPRASGSPALPPRSSPRWGFWCSARPSAWRCALAPRTAPRRGSWASMCRA